MKKKIIICLTAFSLIFVVSAVYSLTVIEQTTARMDALVKLHQVEILREHLLIQLNRAQINLYLKDTANARSLDTVVVDVKAINSIITSCFDCHHSAQITGSLESLKTKVEDYKNGLSRVFTLRADPERVKREEDKTFQIGAGLIDDVDMITRTANQKLEDRTHAAFREVSKKKSLLYLLVAIVPLTGILFSVFFLNRFTRPVHELLTATRRLKSGDLEYRIGNLPDEFAEVAESFNEMAHALQDDRRRMQWAEQLVVLGQMAGGLAHEIKNPLAGIKASMDVLSCDASLSAENRIVAIKVSDQIKRIDSLIKCLTNFARPPKPQFVLSDINTVIDSTASLAERHPAFRDRAKPVTILKDFDRALPETMADPIQLQQVIMNLLLNAVDAIDGEGAITIRTSHRDRMLEIGITDTGKGIDEELAARIFQPFFTTKTGGTGLGLAITKGLVQQHGGTIQVTNNKEGGVTFTIMLPIRALEEVSS